MVENVRIDFASLVNLQICGHLVKLMLSTNLELALSDKK